MLPLDVEDRLLEYVAETFWSAELFVDTMYPWGEAGTFLEKWDGPDEWQREALQLIDKAMLEVARSMADPVAYAAANKDLGNTVRVAVSSGHGVGKTALITWIMHWWLATRPNPQVVATAGTKSQLTTKTWREVKKWLDVCLVGHWFDWTQTTLSLKDSETWKANAIPWSKAASQNFAGTHEQYVLYLFDEASTIDDSIWEVSEGAFSTDGPHLWLAFGNPEQPTGRFRDCWTRFRKFWHRFEVDARKSRLSNKSLIRQWLEMYGEDSDFFRVRVKGQPPRMGPSQLIGVDVIEKAEERWNSGELTPQMVPRYVPRIMGVDPAGGDSEHSAETVMLLRHGPIVRPDHIIALREPDHMRTAALIAAQINAWKPDLVFIDAHGLGKGIFDRLVQLGYDNVIAAYAGERDVIDHRVHYNNRIEWWVRMRDWLPTAAIPYHTQLRDDMMAPRRYYNASNLMLLESKKDMALRGIPSPDHADALALTFAQPSPAKSGDESRATEPEAV